MDSPDFICNLICNIIKLLACLFVFIFGITKFYKKGTPINFISITMAFGCLGLSILFALCESLTGKLIEGFSPEYLGYIGFFLFIISASYGNLDRIIDDNSRAIRPSRIISLIAPLIIIILFFIFCINVQLSLFYKIIYGILFILCAISCYYNLKHAIIPNVDFGFVKAIKPYNILAIFSQISTLSCVVVNYINNNILLILTSILFFIISLSTIMALLKGVKKWII